MEIKPLSSLRDGELLTLGHAACAADVGVGAPTIADVPALRQAPVALVAHKAGRPVGFSVAVPGGDPAIGSLHWLAVVPRMRRQGIGTMLLAETMKLARGAGARVLDIRGLDSRNAAGVEFAKHHAFKRHGIVKLRMCRPTLDKLPPIKVAAGYTLRHYREGDETAWTELFREVFSRDARSRMEPRSVQMFRDEFVASAWWKPERLLFVDAPDGRTVGTTMAWAQPEAGRPVAILHWVGVLAAHRGKRLGATLAVAAMHQHQADGWPDCWLTTETFRAPALKTYEQLGFQPAYWRGEYARKL